MDGYRCLRQYDTVPYRNRYGDAGPNRCSDCNGKRHGHTGSWCMGNRNRLCTR